MHSGQPLISACDTALPSFFRYTAGTSSTAPHDLGCRLFVQGLLLAAGVFSGRYCTYAILGNCTLPVTTPWNPIPSPQGQLI
jgi:hypothetical protein